MSKRPPPPNPFKPVLYFFNRDQWRVKPDDHVRALEAIDELQHRLFEVERALLKDGKLGRCSECGKVKNY